MKIIFWGTRGSIPSPGRNTAVFGGNTPCVEVIFEDGTDVIIDGGTGIRELGHRMLSEQRRADSFLIFSHYHWDHIQGLPFFVPSFVKGNKIRVCGVPGPAAHVQAILSKQMEQPFFPVPIDIMYPMLDFFDLPSDKLVLGTGTITYLRTNHPDHCCAFKFEEGGRTFVYFTDNELFPPYAPLTPRAGMVAFIRETDLLLHDSQFVKAELPSRLGWGHSTNIDSVDFAAEGAVRELLLYHHDPARTDDQVRAIEAEAKAYAAGHAPSLKVSACVEGSEVVLR
ncbi:MAG: MBL fold metallo-hydrolase [Deltaproteobacteria bacterium]|nr:MBL fold metallo-hydrolase [Deltaproteobacteria bacterium]